jgi:outer membrane protein assembly factor BamE (lipoprotein component of BamABCDE complex)
MLKTFIGVLITTLLVGCATSSQHLNEIRIGMDKEEVHDILGDPQSTQANSDAEYLVYSLRDGISKPGTTIVPIAYNGLYFVKMIGGRVDSYGRFSNSTEPAPLPMSTFTPIENHQSPSQPSGSYIQTPNAYGPGIHMDQNGKPVQLVPR